MNNTRKQSPIDPSDTSEKKASEAGAKGDMADAGSMEKIRDILFGNQAKDYEKRFARMESQLNQEALDLKEELLKRIDSLEIYIKQEIKDINTRIKNESKERTDAHKMIQRDVTQEFETLNAKLLQEEENLAKKSTELREQILEQSKQLSADMVTKTDAAAAKLKQTACELDDAKVNRSDLSGFFLEMAMRLSNGDGKGISGPST